MKAVKTLNDFTFIGTGKYLAATYNEHHIYSLKEERDVFGSNKDAHSRTYKIGKINKKQTKWKAAV